MWVGEDVGGVGVLGDGLRRGVGVGIVPSLRGVPSVAAGSVGALVGRALCNR